MKNKILHFAMMMLPLSFFTVEVQAKIDWKKAVGITAGVVGGLALAGGAAYTLNEQNKNQKKRDFDLYHQLAWGDSKMPQGEVRKPGSSVSLPPDLVASDYATKKVKFIKAGPGATLPPPLPPKPAPVAKPAPEPKPELPPKPVKKPLPKPEVAAQQPPKVDRPLPSVPGVDFSKPLTGPNRPLPSIPDSKPSSGSGFKSSSGSGSNGPVGGVKVMFH